MPSHTIQEALAKRAELCRRHEEECHNLQEKKNQSKELRNLQMAQQRQRELDLLRQSIEEQIAYCISCYPLDATEIVIGADVICTPNSDTDRANKKLSMQSSFGPYQVDLLQSIGNCFPLVQITKSVRDCITANGRIYQDILENNGFHVEWDAENMYLKAVFPTHSQ